MDNLHINGDLSLLGPDVRRVGIVGARASTAYGEQVTADIVRALPPDVVIVSGGAYGIDAAAHRAALAHHRRTVAVLPCGLDNVYPRIHSALFERIAETGALVSQFADGTPPNRQNFLDRNRTLAALSDVVVVVEAGQRSGSLHAARMAREEGVPVIAVPGALTSAVSAGTNALIRDGLARGMAEVTDFHNLIVSRGGNPDDQDWCQRCEQVTRWDGETCVRCGRVWGESE